MKLRMPTFQYRFVPSMGNVIHPGNFHPVGTQVVVERMIDRMLDGPTVEDGGNWLLVGGSGGFGSGARVVLGARRGANTLSLSLDRQPNAESANKIRKLGSPGFHRNLAIDRRLRALGRVAVSLDGSAFDPATRERTIAAVREHLDGKLDGMIWALAAPRGLDPRTGKDVMGALRPLGRSIMLKTFTGRDERAGEEPRISEVEIPPGTPEQVIATQFVMGGRIVEQWIEALLAADVLADGFTALTVSYRGGPSTAGMYRDGVIGMAKADLEFHTKALDAILTARLGGRAIAVEGPAVITEASGGIPGMPLYMAMLMDVMGDRFEEPVECMARMFEEHFGEAGPSLDDEGLLRIDDRELAPDVQAEMDRRLASSKPGDRFPDAAYEAFMHAYARTRGFDVPGVDYDAEFDTDEICRL